VNDPKLVETKCVVSQCSLAKIDLLLWRPCIVANRPMEHEMPNSRDIEAQSYKPVNAQSRSQGYVLGSFARHLAANLDRVARPFLERVQRLMS
jgi:hypothetical protein